MAKGPGEREVANDLLELARPALEEIVGLLGSLQDRLGADQVVIKRDDGRIVAQSSPGAQEASEEPNADGSESEGGKSLLGPEKKACGVLVDGGAWCVEATISTPRISRVDRALEEGAREVRAAFYKHFELLAASKIGNKLGLNSEPESTAAQPDVRIRAALEGLRALGERLRTRSADGSVRE